MKKCNRYVASGKMTFSFFAVITLLMFSLFQFACKNAGNEIKVVSKSFNDEVETETSLNITFNRDLIPDSLMDRWEKGNVFKFTPSIEGRYKWVSTHELMFSPSEPLSPCTDYKMELNTSALLAHAKPEWFFNDELVFNFHTPMLSFESANFHWSANDNMQPVLNLNLGFNFPLNPAEVMKRVKALADGKELQLRMAEPDVNNSIHFIADNFQQTDNDVAVKIIIEKGLPVPHSAFTTKEFMAFETVIPSKEKLLINSVETEHTGTEGIVTVMVSQELKESTIKQAVQIEPAIEFDIQKNENGFLISSKFFDINNSYRLTLNKSLEGILGGKLTEEYTQEIVFGKISPSIKFNSTKGMYLGSKGNMNLAVNIVSIPKVEVKIFKIYENNIIRFFKDGYNWGNHYEYDEESEDEYWYEYNYYNTEDYGDLISNQTYETRKLEKQNASTRLLNLNFEDKIKDQHGVYVVQVSSTDQNWVQASKIVSVSDLGLIVKQSEKSIMVIVNSISDTRTMPDVKLNLISNKNQVVKSLVTNNDGIAIFDKPENSFPPFSINLITATLGNDYNFVKLDESNQVQTGRFEVGGKYLEGRKYDAFLYGDRDIYRPGETINLTGIVRDLAWTNPGDLPVKVKIFLPNGRVYKTIRKVLNEQGAFETAVPLPAGIVTGSFRVTVMTADDVVLVSKSISVEEFMPDKIAVKSKLNKEKLFPGDTLTTDITATNLFGPPASDRNYTMEMSLSGDYFYSKTCSDFNFNVYNRSVNFNVMERSGKTDALGMIKEKFIFDRNTYSNMGVLSGKIFTTVFDESGRPVNRENYFSIMTQDVFLGLKYGENYVSLNKPATFEIAAVNAKDQFMKNVKARVQIIKREWQTVIEKVNGRFQYNSQYVDKVMMQQDVVINSKSQFNYTPLLSGEYEVRLSLPGNASYVRQYFYAYGYGRTESTSFEVENDGTIEIELDKKEYKTGDVAHLLFKTPFAGKMIVTIEQDKVLKYYSITTDKKSAMLDVYLKEEHVPNIFISATLIRPGDDGSNPLVVAHGYKNAIVENPSNKLDVKIEAAKNSRSKLRQNIRIKTTPYTSVTVAVVDEGILQLKNFQTPDPYVYFYEPRALMVNSFDIYPYLFPEIPSRKNYTGGSGFDLAKRVNPMSNKRVKLVALWSGIITSDQTGVAQFNVDIPQFNGELRIMAVGYKDNKFGSAEAHMKVADPVVINTGLPRFTSPQDTVMMPVTLSNTTKSNTTANVTVTATGPFNVVSKQNQNVTVKANSETRVDFRIAAMNKTGAGKITVSVNALNEKFTDETDMTVRPAASLQKISGSGEIMAGKAMQLNLSGKFIPSTIESRLVVTRSPVVQFADNLDYLIQYPYGCVEQTTSAAFPQLYFYDLSKTVLKKTSRDPNPNYNINQAIAKLQSMMMSNGALSYWPGGGYESWFGTVFAAHFLWEAKKAGYEVDGEALTRMHQYMINKIKQRTTFVYRYNVNQSREIAPKEIPYSLYVLALANKSQISEMNYYKANDKLLSLDAKYLLAAAYGLSGNKLNYEQMLPRAFEGEISVASTGGSFYSYIRDEAISLNALLEVDPNNQQIGIMARHLSQQIKNNRWLSTQENVFSLIALGKIARMNKNSNASATIKSAGKVLGSASDKEADIKLKDTGGKPVDITSSGTGKLYYYYVTEGINADGSFKQEDSYMRVRKTFYNKRGQQITNLNFNQNDLVVVKISIAGLTNAEIENVVITDMLPAGFEIENPRISAMPDCPWIKNAAYPQHQDIRDDRINLFTSIDAHQKDFYYMVRCVTKGIFRMGPVQADAMYNGEYHSYNGAGVVKIQ